MSSTSKKMSSLPNVTSYLSDDVEAEALELRQQLLEVWKSYVQTIGPSVVTAHRKEQLLELPYISVFHQVQDEMVHIALEWLIEEEIRQDDLENTNFSI
jgi:hypothetical protein